MHPHLPQTLVQCTFVYSLGGPLCSATICTMGQTIMILIVVHSSTYYFPGGVAHDTDHGTSSYYYPGGVAHDSDGGSVGVISPVTQQRQSPELTVFTQHLPSICTGILHGVQHDIAHKAYAQGLISKEVHRTVTGALNRLTPDERTNFFLYELMTRIKIDAVVLTEFVDILKSSDPAYYGALIRKISESSRILCIVLS